MGSSGSNPSGYLNTNTFLPTSCKSNVYFNLLFCNARSVLPKFDELLAICNMHNYHVICFVESDVSNDELFIPGYDIFRRDRDRHGGGILIFVKSDLCASPISYPLPPTDIDFFPLTIDFCKVKFCIVIFL